MDCQGRKLERRISPPERIMRSGSGTPADEVEIKAMCKITSVSAYENMKEDETKCVNLQITEMDCKPEGATEKTAKKVYDKK